MLEAVKDHEGQTMIFIQFLLSAIFLSSVSAFAPNHAATMNAKTFERKYNKVDSLSPFLGENGVTQFRRKDISLQMDPIAGSLIVGIIGLTAAKLDKDEKSETTETTKEETIENPKKEAKEEKSAEIAETPVAESNVDKKSSRPVAVAAVAETVEKSDVAPSDVDGLVKKHAESISSGVKKSSRPSAVVPPSEVAKNDASAVDTSIETRSTPFIVKAVVKLLMPWRKFSNI